MTGIKKLLVVFLVLATLLVSTSYAKADYVTPEVTFGITSDIHGNVYLLQLFVDDTDGADFLIFTGDYATTPSIEEYWANEAIYTASTSPRYYVIGNHDDPDMMIANTEMVETYYSFDYGSFHFIVLDITGGVGTVFGEAQLEWLIDDLAESSKKTIVFYHIPLVPYWRTWKNPGIVYVDAYTVREVLEIDGDVIATFSGHNHVNSEGNTGEDWEYSVNGIHHFSNSRAPALVSLYADGSIRIDGGVYFDCTYEDYGMEEDHVEEGVTLQDTLQKIGYIKGLLAELEFEIIILGEMMEDLK